MFDTIKDLMAQHGTRKVDLAEAIGASAGNICDWFSGRSQPKLEKLIKIADYYGVSLDYIAGRNVVCVTNPEDIAMLQLYQELDARGKTVVMGRAYEEKSRMERSKEDVEAV